jgi:predicted phage terminase large subunit-like protein
MATHGHSSLVTLATGNEAEPYYEQIPFATNRKRPYYGFISGSGAGKTFSGIYRLYANAEWWNPKSMGAIIVPNKSQFTDNIKPVMEEFNLFDYWDYKSVYTEESGLVTRNGERILILSADNSKQIERIKGKNLAYIWMDEAVEIPDRAREIADQRMRVGNYQNLFITTTPNGKDHIFDFFQGDRETTEREYGEGTLITSDDTLAVVGVPSNTNPALEDGVVDRMRRNLPDEIVQQEIEGKFVEIGSGIFTLDMMSYVSVQDIDESWRMNYILGVDPASTADEQQARETDSDYWAISLIGVRPTTGEIYVIDQKRKRGMTLREGISWISNTASQVPAPELIIESNQSQRWLQQELASEGLNTTPVQSTRDKEDKLIDLSIPLENDRIIFVNHNRNSTSENPDDRWHDLRDEMLAFPNGSHDDCLDSLYLAVDNATSSTQALSGDMYGIRE